MGLLYFKTNDNSEIVTLDCEKEITVSRSQTVSSTSTMEKRMASLDSIEGLRSISVEGLVTYSKTARQAGNPTPSEFQDLIDKVVRNKERFTLYSVKRDGNVDLLKDYENMVIASDSYSVGTSENTITVSLTFQEVYVTDSAKVTSIQAQRSVSSKPQTADPTTNGKGGSTILSAGEAEKVRTGLALNLNFLPSIEDITPTPTPEE